MTVEAHHSTRQLLSLDLSRDGEDIRLSSVEAPVEPYLAKKEKNKRLAVRIQGVALAKQGFTCPKIVEMTGYPRRTVQRWVTQYNKSGIKGLRDKPRAGRPVMFTRCFFGTRLVFTNLGSCAFRRILQSWSFQPIRQS